MKAVPPRLESKWAGSTNDVAHDGVRAAKVFEGLPDLFFVHRRCSGGHFLRLRAAALALRVLRLRAAALALRVLRLRAAALALRVLRLRAAALALRVLRLRAAALALRGPPLQAHRLIAMRYRGILSASWWQNAIR